MHSRQYTAPANNSGRFYSGPGSGLPAGGNVDTPQLILLMTGGRTTNALPVFTAIAGEVCAYTTWDAINYSYRGWRRIAVLRSTERFRIYPTAKNRNFT